MHGDTRSFGCPESAANDLERFVREKKKGDAGYSNKKTEFYLTTNEAVCASKKTDEASRNKILQREATEPY